MQKINVTPESIWNEYQKAINFNSSIELYETVKKNENFFIGRQWEGVKAKNILKPVLNIMKRVINYFISMICSDDISANIRPFISENTPETAAFTKIISAEFDRVLENCKLKSKNRRMLRNAAVSGDGCMYFYMNPDADSGQEAEGRIDAEVIDCTEIMFANPYSNDLQKQRFILISSRRDVFEVQEEARLNGVSEDDIALIEADTDYSDKTDDRVSDTGRVTVVLKLWKAGGTVNACKVTSTCTVMPERDTGYKLYPIAFMNWEEVRGCYHGQAAITGLIPNQIYINKSLALAMAAMERNAFPVTIYNEQKLPKGLASDPTKAYGVMGDPREALFTQTGVHEISGQVSQYIDKTIEYTRDTMGASDAALGNINPNNTSAIIAVQKASAVPLELQKMAFYQFVEDYVRIIIDIMATDYGSRQVSYTDEKGNETITDFDFSQLKNMHMRVNVDIGAAAYWSEITQMQTIDNLFSNKIISDPALYLESLPDGVLRNKAQIIAHVKQQQAALTMAEHAPVQTAENGFDISKVLGNLSENELAELQNNPEIAQKALSGE